MLESLDLAKEEIKRADHLMYVSLKYTRTVDILKSIIERLINAFNFGIDALLKKKKVRDIPTIPKIKLDLVRKNYPDEDLNNFLQLYQLFREIDKASFDRAREYRRHVTMTAHLDDKEIEVTIDIIEDYYGKTKEFIEYVESIVKNG